MYVLPMQIASARGRSTTVTVPTNTDTVSGISQVLDAVASSGATQVRYEITGGNLTDSVIVTATPTYYGWVALWNTTTVANGSYSLRSVASYATGATVTSPAISITLVNGPPNTTVLVPANGATMDSTNISFGCGRLARKSPSLVRSYSDRSGIVPDDPRHPYHLRLDRHHLHRGSALQRCSAVSGATVNPERCLLLGRGERRVSRLDATQVIPCASWPLKHGD